MAFATKKIFASIKNVDLILEVVDARAIKTTSILEIEKLSKPVLKIALKSDLADLNSIKPNQNLLIGSIYNQKFRKIILNKINEILTKLKKQKKAKGLINPIFYAMVVGLPNVGKSSLINFLSKHKLTIVENRPAVTKKTNVLKINNNFYIQDNPGVFFKKINNKNNEAFILALLNTIKKDNLPLNNVINFAYNYLVKNYQNRLPEYFKSNMTFFDFIQCYANKRKFYLSKSLIDNNRILDTLFYDLVNGKICKINYEKNS